MLDALRARAGGFLGAASLPRHLRRRATSHDPRNRRSKRPNAKRAKIVDDAGFAAGPSAIANRNPPRTVKSSRYRFAIESQLEVRWCRRARRRPERVRLANRERLALANAAPSNAARLGKTKTSFEEGFETSEVLFRSKAGSERADRRTSAHWRRLETHAWHAKRFALAYRWGWALPLGAPGKGRGWRETMRRAAEHCVAHDASYHAAFVVRFFGPKNERRLNETNVKEPGGSRSATDFRSASPLDTARAFVETLAALKKQKRGSGVRETDFLQTKYVAATATRVRSAAFAAGAVAVDATLEDTSGGAVSPATFVLARQEKNVFTKKKNKNDESSDATHAKEKEEKETPEETSEEEPLDLWVWVPAAAREAAFAAVSTATRSVRFSNLCSEARRADGRLCRFELAGATSAAVLETLAGNARGTSVFRERDGGVTPRGVRSFEARVDAKSVASRRRAAASSASSASLASSASSASLASLASPGLVSPLGSSPLLAAVAGEAFAGTSDKPSGDGDDVCDGTVIPVTAIRRAKPRGGVSGGADAGFTLLAPAECAQKLWLALVALGARATGLREWRWLAVAAGAPAFPEDFPASAAAAEEAERAAEEASRKARRAPPGKRVPAAAIEGAARAAVAFARREKEGVTGVTGVTYARAVVRCFHGGVPTVGAAVLAATPAQRERLRRRGADRSAEGASFDAVFAKEKKTDRRSLARGCDRQTVLGYVTSASAPNAARGVASAVVDARALERAFPERFAKKKAQRREKRASRGVVFPAALLAASASPAAVTPATLELVDDAHLDPVWW